MIEVDAVVGEVPSQRAITAVVVLKTWMLLIGKCPSKLV
tara:strand:+ start:168 stop:284 length:117 start_codon:yes stop_codon:yes gene_type:complete